MDFQHHTVFFFLKTNFDSFEMAKSMPVTEHLWCVSILKQQTWNLIRPATPCEQLSFMI